MKYNSLFFIKYKAVNIIKHRVLLWAMVELRVSVLNNIMVRMFSYFWLSTS